MQLLSVSPFHTSVAVYGQLHSFFEGNNAFLSVCISLAAQVIVCDEQYQLSCGADAGLQCKAGGLDSKNLEVGILLSSPLSSVLLLVKVSLLCSCTRLHKLTAAGT